MLWIWFFWLDCFSFWYLGKFHFYQGLQIRMVQFWIFEYIHTAVNKGHWMIMVFILFFNNLQIFIETFLFYFFCMFFFYPLFSSSLSTFSPICNTHSSIFKFFYPFFPQFVTQFFFFLPVQSETQSVQNNIFFFFGSMLHAIYLMKFLIVMRY